MIELGLIGYPLGHSLSKVYFERKFQELNIDGRYYMMPIPEYSEESIPTLLKEHPELRGFNVTAPWKRHVMQHMDYISPDAQALGGVNVVKICRDKDSIRFEGYNTDWKGFLDSIPEQFLTKDAIILGTGGAASAAAYALSSVGVSVQIATRDINRVLGKGVNFPDNCTLCTYDDLPELIRNTSLIVNATPVGTWPNVDASPDIPYEKLSPEILCYDMVYNPEETMYMKRAAEHRAVVMNGLGMLHRQADLAWEIWNS